MEVSASPQLCKFCGESSNLVRSHIVSEFFFKELYEDRKYTEVVAASDQRDLIRQKGTRERLLCSVCEGFIAKEYEDYGAKAFRMLKSQTREAQGAVVVSGLDYRRFKLCMLTQLWRMSLSACAHWQHVRLPSDTQHDILLMLRSGDPRGVADYGIMAESVFADDGEHFNAFIPPVRITNGDSTFILATFAGLSWYYALGCFKMGADLKGYFLNLDGTLKIGAKALRDTRHIQMFADELEAVGKFPWPDRPTSKRE